MTGVWFFSSQLSAKRHSAIGAVSRAEAKAIPLYYKLREEFLAAPRAVKMEKEKGCKFSMHPKLRQFTLARKRNQKLLVRSSAAPPYNFCATTQ